MKLKIYITVDFGDTYQHADHPGLQANVDKINNFIETATTAIDGAVGSISKTTTTYGIAGTVDQLVKGNE